MPIRLLITDIDGTLLDDAGNLPDLNRAALAHCRARGVRTCLATGRRWTTCSRLLDRLDLRPLIDYCICNNGMVLRDIAAGATLVMREFPLDDVLAAIARLNGLSLDPIVLGHNPDGRTRDVFYRRDALLNADFIDKNPDHCIRLDDWDGLAGKPLMELVLIGPQRALEEAAASLAGLDLEIAIIRNTYYKEYMLEITPPGVSKLSGARDLLARLALGDGEALVVGDSGNDYAMIRHLPVSVAVANADPLILAAASEVTASNAEGGLGRAVFRHLGGREAAA